LSASVCRSGTQRLAVAFCPAVGISPELWVAVRAAVHNVLDEATVRYGCQAPAATAMAAVGR
jgi:hypothetical protein